MLDIDNERKRLLTIHKAVRKLEDALRELDEILHQHEEWLMDLKDEELDERFNLIKQTIMRKVI